MEETVGRMAQIWGREILVEDMKISDQVEDLDTKEWKILECSRNKYFRQA